MPRSAATTVRRMATSLKLSVRCGRWDGLLSCTARGTRDVKGIRELPVLLPPWERALSAIVSGWYTAKEKRSRELPTPFRFRPQLPLPGRRLRLNAGSIPLRVETDVVRMLATRASSAPPFPVMLMKALARAILPLTGPRPRPSRTRTALRVEQLEAREQPANLTVSDVAFATWEAGVDGFRVDIYDPKDGSTDPAGVVPFGGGGLRELAATASGRVAALVDGWINTITGAASRGRVYFLDPAAPGQSPPYVSFGSITTAVTPLPDGRVAFASWQAGINGFRVDIYDPKAEPPQSPVTSAGIVPFGGGGLRELQATADGRVAALVDGWINTFTGEVTEGRLYVLNPAAPSQSPPYLRFGSITTDVTPLPDGRLAFASWQAGVNGFRVKLYNPVTKAVTSAGVVPFGGGGLRELAATASGRVAAVVDGWINTFTGEVTEGRLYFPNPAAPSQSPPYASFGSITTDVTPLPDGRVAFAAWEAGVDGFRVNIYDPKAKPPQSPVTPAGIVPFGGGGLRELQATADGRVAAVVDGWINAFTGEVTEGRLLVLNPAVPSQSPPYVLFGSTTTDMTAAPFRPDIKIIDATTTDLVNFKQIAVKFAIEGFKVGPDFKFQAFLSDDETYAKDEDT